MSCLGGWTAGNYLGSVADVARFTYELYNTKEPQIVSAQSQAHLTNFTTQAGSALAAGCDNENSPNPASFLHVNPPDGISSQDHES